jgi:hypothetical protein
MHTDHAQFANKWHAFITQQEQQNKAADGELQGEIQSPQLNTPTAPLPIAAFPTGFYWPPSEEKKKKAHMMSSEDAELMGSKPIGKL